MRRIIPGLCLAAALIDCGGSSAAGDAGVAVAIDEEVAAAVADETSDEVAAGAPVVADRYQSSIDRAWTKAVVGENPANACAGLKGRLMALEGAPGEDEGRLSTPATS